MATSMSTLCRTLSRSLLKNPKFSAPIFSKSRFSTSSHEDVDDDDSVPDSAQEEVQSSAAEAQGDDTQKRAVYDRPLENGLDVGVYKAILLGQVGQKPMQKTLKSGTMVTLFTVGTGGIRNNRRPFDDEDPKEYAKRGIVQWHRVSVYPQRLGDLVMKQATPGATIYLEGNLETKIFNDPVTGLVRRVREIALRRNGRIVFLGKGFDSEDATEERLKGVGYY